MKKRLGSIAVLGLALGACSDASVPAGPGRLAPFIQASGDLTAQVVPNEYIVVLRKGSDVRAEAAAVRAAGGTIIAEWEHALRGFAVRVPSTGVMSTLRTSRNVEFVEPNGVVLEPPVLDQHLGLEQAGEGLDGQQFITQAAAEALHIGVLPG